MTNGTTRDKYIQILENGPNPDSPEDIQLVWSMIDERLVLGRKEAYIGKPRAVIWEGLTLDGEQKLAELKREAESETPKGQLLQTLPATNKFLWAVICTLAAMVLYDMLTIIGWLPR